jgi:beta-galactosidase
MLAFIALAAFCTRMMAADSPRERILLDQHWRFHLGDAPDVGAQLDYPEVKDLHKTLVEEIGREGELATNLPNPVSVNLGGSISYVRAGFDDRNWRQLDLPHDWAVELEFSEKADANHGFKPVGPRFPQSSIGWYRREFQLPGTDHGKTLWLEFDGAYRNSLVWLNGHCLGRHLDGYSSFRYNISQFANCGGNNELVVRVDATRFEGWFYEGAGLYRHVWLVKTSPLYIAPDGIFVWTTFSNNVPEGPATIHLTTEVANQQESPKAVGVRWQILAPDGKPVPKGEESQTSEIPPGSTREFARQIILPSPALWSPESPNIYRLITMVESGGILVDRQETEFGVRILAFDATNGFSLNGKRYQIKGTCNHQDHAGVGTALPDALQYFRVRKLKQMGCNAIRMSHNPPTPELLQACDRLGLLVMDENRRMDNSAWELNELKSLVLRDRNHPSVFIWSLGNEEGELQGSRTNATLTPESGREAGRCVLAPMQALVHQLDPTRPCTVAMNGGWGYGMSTLIDVQGLNYGTRNIQKFHAAFPAQPALGTETASTRFTRGIYADDKTNGYLSAFGSNALERAWSWWPYYASNSFTSGGFVWTGFDYRGEPVPYKWPCINSHFGLMDMCGFPKDVYYYYQSWWTETPVLHVMPHWTWPGKAGQTIPVRVFSNCKEVELYLNGKSLGRQAMRLNWFLDWNVPYEPGVLAAKGYDGNRLLAATKVQTAGPPAALQFAPDRSVIKAGLGDLSIVDVAVVDTNGCVVPTASDLIDFQIIGPGKIIGVGNGDPSDHSPDKATRRKAFCGLAQLLVQSSGPAGLICLTASSPGLLSGTCKLQSE